MGHKLRTDHPVAGRLWWGCICVEGLNTLWTEGRLLMGPKMFKFQLNPSFFMSTIHLWTLVRAGTKDVNIVSCVLESGRYLHKTALTEPINNTKHLEFGKTHWNYDWMGVLWSDETKIECFCHTHHQHVCRQNGMPTRCKRAILNIKYNNVPFVKTLGGHRQHVVKEGCRRWRKWIINSEGLQHIGVRSPQRRWGKGPWPFG